MTDDKKNSQGGSSLSHSGETTKKDALKGRYVNRTTELRKEKQKAQNRQQYAPHSETYHTGSHSVSGNTYSYSKDSNSRTQTDPTYSDKTYNDHYDDPNRHYINTSAPISSSSETEITDKRATSEKAAALKKKLESKLNDENSTATKDKYDEKTHVTEQTILSFKNTETENKHTADDSSKNPFGKINNYESMSKDIKDSYKKTMQVEQFTAKQNNAKQQTADMYFQHLENKTLIDAEKAVDAAVTSYAVEGTVRDNAAAGFEMLSEAAEAVNSGDAAKLIAQPAMHFIKGQLNQHVVNAAEKISDINALVSASDSVGGTVTDVAAYAAADAAKDLAKQIFIPTDRKMKKQLEKKVNRINKKTLKKQNAIQKARSDAMNGNISDKLEKKLDKIELKQEKYKQKLIAENKKLQKQQYFAAIKREKKIGVYKRFNAAYGKNAAAAALKKKGFAAVIAAASGAITVILVIVLLLVFISSLFFWLDKPDDKKQQKEKELLEDYVVYIGDYFDRQQISILQKVDRFWGGFKPDKYNYQNNSPAYIECLDNYDNRWLKLENFTYENVIALAAVKKFHELETKTSFSDGEEIEIKTYVMSITEQDLDDVMTGLFNVVIELQVGPCNGDCTETETVTATEIKTFQGYDKYNNPIYYLKGYNIEHKFSYACGKAHYKLHGNVINYSHYGEDFILTHIIKPPSPDDYATTEEYEKARRMAENDRKVYDVYKDYIDKMLGTATTMPNYESASERQRLAAMCDTAEPDGKYVNSLTRQQRPSPNPDFTEESKTPKSYTRISLPISLWHPSDINTQSLSESEPERKQKYAQKIY